MEFGVVLRKYRIKCQLSQQVVADIIGVTQGTYSNWEADRCCPKAQYIQELARTLHIPMGEIMPEQEDAISTSLSEMLENHPLVQRLKQDVGLYKARIIELEVENRLLKQFVRVN